MVAKQTKKQAKARAAELRVKIAEADQQYYQDDSPVISDTEYDTLKAELKEIEEKYPDLLEASSPTQKIGEKPSGKFKRQRHMFPMLSITNVYTLPGVFTFLGKFLPTDYVILQPKVDGTALSLYYENGILTKAVTRGDGEFGDDVTRNVAQISSIPKILESAYPPKFIEIRGEIYVDKADFDALNVKALEDGEEQYKNPRNLASGTLKNSDPMVCKERKLKFVAHGFNEAEMTLTSFNMFSEFCSTHGLPQVESQFVSIGKLTEKDITEFFDKAKNLPYVTDGVVIKLNDKATCIALGETGSVVRWAIAYKRPNEAVQTVLKDIAWTAGRTGRITPTAVVEPITIGGVTIENASLHNPSIIETLGLTVGCSVGIERAGEVIPQIVKVFSHVKNAKPCSVPTECPECKEQLVKDGPNIFCLNPSCPAKLFESILHFGGRDYMDIRGLGPVAVKALIDKGLVTCVSDLYTLKNSCTSVEKLLGKKTALNLCHEIEKSKSRGMAKVLAALGYPKIGRHIGELMASIYKNVDEMCEKVTVDNLLKLDGISDITAQAIYKSINSNAFKYDIGGLKNAGVNLESIYEKPKVIQDSKKMSMITGKRVCVTGTLSRTRDSVQEDLVKLGAIPVSAVNKKTDILIVGTDAGSKLEKAHELGIQIWNEERFNKELT